MLTLSDPFGRTPHALAAHARLPAGVVRRDPMMDAAEPMTAADARRAMTRQAVRAWRERKRAEAAALGVTVDSLIGRKRRRRS